MATFINTATLSYNNRVTNSNVVTGEILEVVSATKTAVSGSYRQGDTMTYAVSIVNSGTSSLTGVTISDNLGGYTFGGNTVYPLTYVANSARLYTNGAASAAPTETAGPPLSFSGITVPAGGNVMLLYEASVNGFAPLATGGTITNTATISGAGITPAIVASDTVAVAEGPNLTISKSVCPETVVEDGQINYTFVIQNSGNTAATAADNIVVSDSFDPIINPITVTLNGTAWSSPTNYTYDTGTGEFSSVAGQITVPAATYTQGTDGRWIITPGVTVLKVSGTV